MKEHGKRNHNQSPKQVALIAATAPLLQGPTQATILMQILLCVFAARSGQNVAYRVSPTRRSLNTPNSSICLRRQSISSPPTTIPDSASLQGQRLRTLRAVGAMVCAGR